MIGGQPTYIDYISPTQVNVLVPSNVATGVPQVVVKTANGTGTGFPLTINKLEPGILAPSSFKVGSTPYAAGILADGSYALPAGKIWRDAYPLRRRFRPCHSEQLRRPTRTTSQLLNIQFSDFHRRISSHGLL